jgi:DNA-binding response OmpR family regulator
VARILIIDDDELVRRTLRRALEDAGHKIAEAVDGRDGVAKFEAMKPDLVLVDLIMPKQEGIETITGLRRHGADVPIVAMSGGGRIGTGTLLEAAAKLGANRTITKPFRIDELLSVIEDCLKPAP